MPYVEKRERLVQKKITCCAFQRMPNLCQHAGELHSLFFAAAQRSVAAVRHGLNLKVLHHLFANVQIACAGAGTKVRIPPHHHKLAHRPEEHTSELKSPYVISYA